MSLEKTAAGLLVLDAGVSIIACNREAIEILLYPRNAETIRLPEVTQKIRADLVRSKPSEGLTFAAEYQSGKRSYFCRAFVLNGSSVRANHNSPPLAVVLLERSPFGATTLAQICEQFELTQRERRTVELLLQGLTSKEIAARMDISPNTVKAFLRMVMLKMGVSTRAAIVGKILQSRSAVSAAGSNGGPTNGKLGARSAPVPQRQSEGRTII
jgi:DNA-binding CsgD family transcriptional regulator